MSHGNFCAGHVIPYSAAGNWPPKRVIHALSVSGQLGRETSDRRWVCMECLTLRKGLAVTKPKEKIGGQKILSRLICTYRLPHPHTSSSSQLCPVHRGILSPGFWTYFILLLLWVMYLSSSLFSRGHPKASAAPKRQFFLQEAGRVDHGSALHILSIHY